MNDATFVGNIQPSEDFLATRERIDHKKLPNFGMCGCWGFSNEVIKERKGEVAAKRRKRRKKGTKTSTMVQLEEIKKTGFRPLVKGCLLRFFAAKHPDGLKFKTSGSNRGVWLNWLHSTCEANPKNQRFV